MSDSDQITHDQAEAAFTAALAKFQAAMPHIGKDQKADTGSFSYSYADLADIAEATRPVLAEHGFAWSAKTMVTDAGFILLSSLRHSAGWKETAEWPLPDPSRATPQQVGSALSYGRRYTFTALTGITPGGEDDDAKAGSTRPAAERRPDPAAKAKAEVWEHAQRLGMDLDALKERYAATHDGELLEDATVAHLRAFAKALAREGANGLPLNKDGSVSRSQTTEEERVEAGMASKEQAKDHEALVQEVTSDGKKAERIPGGIPPEEDPWADVTVAQPGATAGAA